MAHLKAKRISKYLEEIMMENVGATTTTKNHAIAKRLVEIALSDETPGKLALEAITIIVDRLEGKALQTNINAEMEINPFASIDTSVIEELKKKLIAGNAIAIDKPIDGK